MFQTVANRETLTTLQPVRAHDSTVMALLVTMVDVRWTREVIDTDMPLNSVENGLKAVKIKRIKRSTYVL